MAFAPQRRPAAEAFGTLRGEVELADDFDELPVKSALGKLRVPGDLPDRLEQFAFEPLAVTDKHAWAVRSLPAAHNDPFDRLLVAQAVCERATIVSADAIFDQYGIARLW
jgi:PIN domain nuclease of toxin-antitoxin system